MEPHSGSRFVLLGGFGLALLLVGAALRFWPGLVDAGTEATILVSIFTVLATFAVWMARPLRLGPGVSFAMLLVALWGVGIALVVLVVPRTMALESLPRALELSGGALWLLATVGRQELSLGRGRSERPPALDVRKARRLSSGRSLSTVSAGDLAGGDRIEVRGGDVVPVDGVVETGRLIVVDEGLYAGPERRVVEVGERVFAGTRADEGEAVVQVAHAVEASVQLERERRREELREHALHPGRSLRGAALLAGVGALGLVGLAFWLERGSTDPEWQRFGTTAIAALAAVFPAIPLVAVLRGRVAALDEAMDRGVWFTRPGDVAAFFRVRGWRMDPMLLAGSGPVETLAFGRHPGPDVLRWAEAVARPWRGPEVSSLGRALRKQSLDPAVPTAVKTSGGLHYGTIEGQRIIFGSPEAFENERGLRLDRDQSAAVRFLRERPGQVWLVATDSDGLVGAVGVALNPDAGAKASFEGLDARLLPTLEAASMDAVTKAVGATRRPREPGGGDASLLAGETEAPHRGLRLRVLDFGSDVRLQDRAAPRLLRGALAQLPDTVRVTRAMRRAARIRATWVTVGCALLAGALVGFRALEPAFGVLIGRLGLFLAFTPFGGEPSSRGD